MNTFFFINCQFKKALTLFSHEEVFSAKMFQYKMYIMCNLQVKKYLSTFCFTNTFKGNGIQQGRDIDLCFNFTCF